MTLPTFCSRYAAMKAETIRPGTCKMVNHKVFRIDVNICGSVNTHWKLASPANDLVPNPSQLENASIRAKISGPSMKTTRPTSCGARKPAVKSSFAGRPGSVRVRIQSASRERPASAPVRRRPRPLRLASAVDERRRLGREGLASAPPLMILSIVDSRLVATVAFEAIWRIAYLTAASSKRTACGGRFPSVTTSREAGDGWHGVTTSREPEPLAVLVDVAPEEHQRGLLVLGLGVDRHRCGVDGRRHDGLAVLGRHRGDVVAELQFLQVRQDPAAQLARGQLLAVEQGINAGPWAATRRR